MRNIPLPLRVIIDTDTVDKERIKRLETYHIPEYINIYHINNHDFKYYIDALKNPDGLLSLIVHNLPDINIEKKVNPFISEEYALKYMKDFRIDRNVINIINIFETLVHKYINSTLLITNLNFNRECLVKIRHSYDHTPYNFLDINEALDFINLLFKANEKYYITPQRTAIKFRWYENYIRFVMPFFFKAEVLIASAYYALNYGRFLKNHFFSLKDRLHDIIYSVDKLGIQMYNYDAELNKAAMINYYFCYWVILFMGIFDSLAWITNIKYNLRLEKNIDVGLVKKIFKKKLSKKNAQLYKYIIDNRKLIDLMNDLRDTVTHRERPYTNPYINYNYKYSDWIIYIEDDLYNKIKQFTGNNRRKLEDWGIKQVNNNILLHPYHFARTTTFELFQYVEKFLSLLNILDLTDKLNETDKRKIESALNSEIPMQDKETLKEFCSFRLI